MGSQRQRARRLWVELREEGSAEEVGGGVLEALPTDRWRAEEGGGEVLLLWAHPRPWWVGTPCALETGLAMAYRDDLYWEASGDDVTRINTE
ncbi:MAG: hypothetical protein R3253_09000 [Longimicrobiales bacterium]|nr:hypothetical protein [Longimicrobiales bacterium]